MIDDLTAAEKGHLDDMVSRRTLDLKKPPWMQPRRERALKREARRLIGTLPPSTPVRTGQTKHYDAPARIRKAGPGADRRTHEAGSDGRPICAFRQYDWSYEEIGAGPVTCSKCAAASS